ncbi:HlyU family transcriptional regulator [Aquibium microcysteis]|uniref:HlyU family transcriptional regulator n=1 Tax=Aquibium microcysteis TaxID=675281 RepID=UPI00165D2D40|nr:HlyU family transcriptional regulator [Aquibium microcysteis]
MSFLKKLFGLGGGDDPGGAEPQSSEAQEYQGFTIRATPFKSDGQYQTCAVITKEVGGAMKEHRLIRADRFAALDTAVEISFRKARQMIDEQGDRLFG